MNPLNRYRTIWLANVRLEASAQESALLLDFLRHNESEYLYVAGPRVGEWAAAPRGPHKAAVRAGVLQALRRRASEGVRVVYLSGERGLRRRPLAKGDGEFAQQPRALHTTADDRQLLVLHGDALRGAVRYAPVVACLGAWSQPWATRLARWQQALACALGLEGGAQPKPEGWAGAFEAAAVREAHLWDVEGIVGGCGGRPAVRRMGGILCANAGDWLSHHATLVEHTDGRMEIIRWSAASPEKRASPGEQPARLRSAPPARSGFDPAAQQKSARRESA